MPMLQNQEARTAIPRTLISAHDMVFGRRAFAVALAAWLLLGAVTPGAAQSSAKTFEYNLDNTGLLLKGYDPVAYFRNGAPAKGSKQFTASHRGATFWFANADNRDAFNKEPGKYLPAYGGYCAYGVAQGYKVDGDPTVWKIVDNKLYVNLNRSIGRKFNADISGLIKQADAKWPGMKDKAPDQVNK
jgi:YHS domain-containing protein